MFFHGHVRRGDDPDYLAFKLQCLYESGYKTPLRHSVLREMFLFYSSRPTEKMIIKLLCLVLVIYIASEATLMDWLILIGIIVPSVCVILVLLGSLFNPLPIQQ